MRVINDPHFFMKIFLDTAETDLIRKYYGTGLIDGITTNPTLIRKSGRDPEEVYQEIQDIGIKDISMEVVGDSNEMIEDGIRLACLLYTSPSPRDMTGSRMPSSA